VENNRTLLNEMGLWFERFSGALPSPQIDWRTANGVEISDKYSIPAALRFHDMRESQLFIGKQKNLPYNVLQSD